MLYGCNGGFRAGVTEAGLTYAVGIQSNATVWPPGEGPLAPIPKGGRGRPAHLMQRSPEHLPVSVGDLAKNAVSEFETVYWREGSKAVLTSRFARWRVRPASRDDKRSTPHDIEWLVVEWPEDEDEPTKYWFSTLPETIKMAKLVDIVKMRWRIERDYQELKSELGLAHYEGRGWRGFHHHATLTIAAYGFLIRERADFPPSKDEICQKSAIPHRPYSRGSPNPT